MITSLSLDPSINSAGVALWHDDRLVAAGRIVSPYEGGEHGMACLAMSAAVTRWCVEHNAKPQRLTFEWPQIYRAAKSKGDPNDLIALAGVGMAVATTLLSMRNLTELKTPTPAEWCGQVPKKCQTCLVTPGKKKCKACRGSAWKTPRGYRIEGMLRAGEKALIPDQHDVIDGVGLGLFGVGRYKLAGVFPGAV